MSDKRAEIVAWLDEQEAICRAAMDAPWAVAGTTDQGCYWIVGRAPVGDRSVEVSICGRGDWPLRSEPSAANGRFIAAARTVLPQTLAALRAEVEAHKEQVHVMGNTPLGYCGQCDPVDEWPCLTIQRIHAATVGR